MLLLPPLKSSSKHGRCRASLYYTLYLWSGPITSTSSNKKEVGTSGCTEKCSYLIYWEAACFINTRPDEFSFICNSLVQLTLVDSIENQVYYQASNKG